MQPHNLITLTTIGALVVYCVSIGRVGRARSKFGVSAPATTGHDMFERHFRVQMNTLEQLALFLPCLWMFALYWPQVVGAALGAVWIIGRAIYIAAYVSDPKTRSMGFGIGALATLILMIGVVWGAVRQMLVTGGI
jgi:glutathione S-transferase